MAALKRNIASSSALSARDCSGLHGVIATHRCAVARICADSSVAIRLVSLGRMMYEATTQLLIAGLLVWHARLLLARFGHNGLLVPVSPGRPTTSTRRGPGQVAPGRWKMQTPRRRLTPPTLATQDGGEEQAHTRPTREVVREAERRNQQQ